MTEYKKEELGGSKMLCWNKETGALFEIDENTDTTGMHFYLMLSENSGKPKKKLKMFPKIKRRRTYQHD